MKEIKEDQFRTISNLFILASELIEAIDDLQGTMFANVKLQKKLQQCLPYLEPVHTFFHSRKLVDSTLTPEELEQRNEEAHLHFFYLHKYFADAVKLLLALPAEKAHLGVEVLEQLLNEKE